MICPTHTGKECKRNTKRWQKEEKRRVKGRQKGAPSEKGVTKSETNVGMRRRLTLVFFENSR